MRDRDLVRIRRSSQRTTRVLTGILWLLIACVLVAWAHFQLTVPQ